MVPPIGTPQLRDLEAPLLISINQDDPPPFPLMSPISSTSSASSPFPTDHPLSSPSPASSIVPLSSPSLLPQLPSAPLITRQLSESTAKKLAQGNFFRQLPAMLWKNALLKVRYPVSFFMELLSPLIVLSILVLGWVLSQEGIQTVDSMVYANDTQIVNSIFNDITIVPSGSAPNDTQCYRTRNLPPSTSFCFQGSDVDVLNAILDYNGPTSVPSIDEYVGLHRAFEIASRNTSNPAETIAALDALTDHQLTNIIYLGTLAFSPDIPAVHSLLDLLNRTHVLFKTLDLRVFDSEGAAVSDVLALKQRYWAVVHFNDLDIDGGHVDYVIRMNYTALPSTSTTISKFQLGLDSSYKRYYYSGFLTLQTMIDTAVLYTSAHPSSSLLSVTAPNNSYLVTSVNITTVPMPTPGYQGSSFYTNIGPLISLVMAMCMLFPVSRLIKGIVEEKESRTKETMKMMGLLDSVFVASWFISSLVQFTFIALCISVLMHCTLLPNTEFSLLFFFFFVFIVSEITFSFLLSVFFSSAKVAGIVGSILIFAAVIPRYAFFNADPNEAILGKTVVSFLSPTAFCLGADVLLNYEGVNLGLSWGGIQDDSFSLFRVLMMMSVDALLYGWLAWYLEHVFPFHDYGQSLPFYFCLMPSFWFKSCMDVQREVEPDGDGDQGCDPRFIEHVPASLQPAASVVIRSLRRVFSEGRGRAKRETVAVHSLNLTFYEGQITALLGKNGAGKTTTISMLTGLITPTSGDCVMYGNSIRQDMSLIRKSLGVCSQQDVLFDRLTVREHLVLYAHLKGVEKGALEAEVSNYIAQCGLADKVDTWTSALSGGQRRKLSVALALIGGSRIVFLDEPTSGMDPYSRRSTWELLRLNKEGRVMIFTTHYMDEADLLGDRIAIMSDGKLQCCGSSLFLKSRYGVGYNLTMTRGSHRWNPTEVTRLMLRFVPDSHLLSSAAGEISYRLPLASVSRFPGLFKEIDRRKSKLGVGGYGISMTTLEEVFLRISNPKLEEEEEEDAAKSERKESSPQLSVSPASSLPGTPRKPSLSTFLLADTADGSSSEEILSRTRQSVKASTQMWELFRKRYICALRDLSGKFYETCLPVLVVALVLLILKLNVNPAGPEILLSSSLYNPPQTDAALSFDAKDLDSTSHYVFSASFPLLENGTFFFLDHRPSISMWPTPYNTSLAISEYDLLPTIKSHSGTRYGCLVLNDTVYTRFNWTSGGIAKNDVAIQMPLTMIHNASYIHALPVLTAELQQARFAANRLMTGRGGNMTASPVTYLVRNHPLPLTQRENLRIQTYLTLFAALFVMVPFCYLPASFVLFVVKERTVKSKHLQLVSGVNPNLYWASAYLWDSVNYLAVCIAVMCVFLAYENSAFVGSVDTFFATFLLLLLYGLACTPLSYCYSFLFDNFTSAQVGIVGLHFVTGFGLIVVNFIMDSVGNFAQINQSLKPVYRIFPTFNLGEGLINLSTRDFILLATSVKPHAFAWEVIGRNVTFLSCEMVVYLGLTLFIEHGWGWWMLRQLALRQDSEAAVETRRVKEDEDVARERKRIEQGDQGMTVAEVVSPNKMRTTSSSPPPPPLPTSTDSPPAPAAVAPSNGIVPSPPSIKRTLAPRASLSVPGNGHDLPTSDEPASSPRRKWSADSVDSVSSRVSDESDQSEDVIRIKKLRKVWPRRGAAPTVAVTDLSLGIPRGICFGFLGINGAGKTSTLKMLTGDELPTSGCASINGYDVVSQSSFVQRERGYCPQSDPLLDMLTGREQLTLYARLRGIPRRYVAEVVWSLLERLGLGKICDRRCGGYSGGNKRKLSLAIAVIGDPSVLFLDEPSTGMDPVSRRFMWGVISAVADSRSVILTSHSMEEVEALCNLIGIMVSGRLRCLGSIQHLKSRFGDHYHLDVNTLETHTQRVKKYIEEAFNGAVLEEEHACRLKYGLPKSCLSLAHAFGSIERMKAEVGITEYSLAQSSLEQIFLSTVRKAEEEELHMHRQASRL